MNKRTRLAAGFLALLLVLSLNAPAFAADSAAGTTIRLEETEGTVTVKNASGKAQSVRADMRLYNGYTVTTGKSSSAYISMDGTKAVKLDSSSKAEVKKSGSQLEVSLLSGNVFFNVTEPLKSTETLNIRTSTMVTGIRGSFGWVGQKEVGLVHGSVVVTCTDPATGAVHTETMQSGESVRYVPEGTEGAPAEQAFVKSGIKTEDVPLIVVEEVAKDETLQAQIAEDVPQIDVTELIGNIETLREEAAAEEETAQEQLDAQTAAQTEELSGATSGPVYAEVVEEAAAASSSSDDGGSYTPPAAPSVVTAPANATTANVENLLAQSTTTTVNVATTAGTLQDLANLSVPAGKTLNITGNGAVNTEDLANSGTINVAEGATLNISGTSSNLSANTIVNNGTVNISGTFHNGGATAGRFVNNGKLEFGTDGKFINHHNGVIDGTKPEGAKVTQYRLVTYNTNGGSEIAAQELASGTALSAALPKSNPTKADCAFEGWYTNEALTESAVNTNTLTENLTLYAKWLEVSTVFVSGVTTVTEGEDTAFVRYTKLNGTTNTAAYSGTKDGVSSLVGWCKIETEIDSSEPGVMVASSLTIIKKITRLENQASENRTDGINSSEKFTITGDGSTTATYSCDKDTTLIVGKLVTESAAGETATTTTLHTRISTGNITPDASSSLEDKNVFYVYSGTKVLYVFALGTDSTVGSGTSGVLYVQSVTTSSATTVTGQMDGGTAASYTVTNSSIIPTEFAAGSPYLVYYDLGTINAVDTLLSSATVSQVYSSNSKTLHVDGVAYTIDDGARFYNIVRKSADDIGVVTLVSGWPDLDYGTTVYIVTATGGGNLATAVYYVTTGTGT